MPVLGTRAGASVRGYGLMTTLGPPVVSGGTLTSDATYYYRTFLANGTFALTGSPLATEIIVLGGGGGGGGAGGGAGGLFYATPTISAGNYSVVIGAGGPQGNGDPTSAGVDSTFGSLTAGKGGGAGGWGSNNQADLIGGCGGGAYGLDSIWPQYGGTSNQTGTGGTGYGTSNAGTIGQRRCGGGGAGLGSAGDNASSGQQGGAGGAGSNTWSAWASATSTGSSGYYGGGGGGGGELSGSSGRNGGGNGANAGGSATSGATNTGSGGGGKYGTPSGNGGSGIVIVRYLKSAVQLWHIGLR